MRETEGFKLREYRRRIMFRTMHDVEEEKEDKAARPAESIFRQSLDRHRFGGLNDGLTCVRMRHFIIIAIDKPIDGVKRLQLHLIDIILN